MLTDEISKLNELLSNKNLIFKVPLFFFSCKCIVITRPKNSIANINRYCIIFWYWWFELVPPKENKTYLEGLQLF
jgi:hypothetical protein